MVSYISQESKSDIKDRAKVSNRLQFRHKYPINAYAYTLGRVLVDEDKPEEASQFIDIDESHHPTHHK
jgi:hypothetical protein